MPALTLDRLLASIGFGSRKEARALVRMGFVELDGKVLDDPFMEFAQRPECITVNGEEVTTQETFTLPKVVNTIKALKEVYSLLPDRFTAMGIQSVGRLDADSEGLLLLSNQGDFIHRVESPKKGMLKYYRVGLARPFTAEQEAELLKGVMLKDERRPVLAREIRAEGDTVVIAIGEGLYHQVRRMFAVVGNHVMTLRREAIGPVALDETLGKGGWRFLTDDEVASLMGS